VSVRRLAAIRQVLADHDVPRHSDAHTIGTACERQPPGHDPAGAVIPAQVAHVRPCRVHGGKSRPCGQVDWRRDVGDVGVAAAIRHPSHTMAAAASRSRLAAIRLVLAAAHGPRHPDAHTIGTACERTICYGNQHIAAGILDFKTDSIADDTVGHAPQASPGIRTPTGSAPPVSVSRLAAIP